MRSKVKLGLGEQKENFQVKIGSRKVGSGGDSGG